MVFSCVRLIMYPSPTPSPPALKPFSSCSIITEFLPATGYIIQSGVSAIQYIMIPYLFLDIHVSIEFGHLASSGISPTEKGKKKKTAFKIDFSMCYLYALFPYSKQFHFTIIINTYLEYKKTFKLSTCLRYGLKACYSNSRWQRKIFNSYCTDAENDKIRRVCA